MKFLFIFLAIILTSPISKSQGDELWVYFGTYTRGKDSEGVYSSKLNLKTGQLSKPVLAAKGDNPSFLTILHFPLLLVKSSYPRLLMIPLRPPVMNKESKNLK